MNNQSPYGLKYAIITFYLLHIFCSATTGQMSKIYGISGGGVILHRVQSLLSPQIYLNLRHLSSSGTTVHPIEKCFQLSLLSTKWIKLTP